MRKIIIGLIFFSSSCTTTSTRENDPADINRASFVMDKFYSCVMKKDFDKASAFAGGDLSATELKGVLVKFDSIWGNMQHYTLTWAHTSVTKTNGLVSGSWELTYDVGYEKSLKNEESFYLLLVNDSIVINAYHSKQPL